MQRIVGLILLAAVAAANIQRPFSTPSFQESEPDEYQFAWPIRKVAIIGAGPSGIIAYRELSEAGLDVRVFERDSVPGGNWHYTEQVPHDAPVPNAPAPIGDFVPSFPPANVELPYSQEFEDDGEIWRDHRGPKPIWESMTSSAPVHIQQFPQWPWPVGTQWEVTQYQTRNYVRSYASYLNINSNDENPATAYNTRVERVEKRINDDGQEQGWRLWLRSLELTQRKTYRVTWWTEDFDAVVVATGRYSAPSMPFIPGLAEWVQRFPQLVRHSRQYRRPEVYANKTVLIVGAATSGAEISRDINYHATKVYQSFRSDSDNRTHLALANNLRLIPKNTTLVGEIEQFLPIPEGSTIQSGCVLLKNGTILSGIDSVILATGYRYSFPFLPQYYDDPSYERRPDSATPFLPLDGSHIRDLYLDQFYIRDPTLAFLNVPSGIRPFLLLEYTTLALAKVWTNKAKLPSSETMQVLYDKTVEERGGHSKYVMFWGPERFVAMVTYLMGWLNEAAAKYGGRQVDGLPKDFRESIRYWEIVRFGAPRQVIGRTEDETLLTDLGIVPTGGVNQRGYDDLFYDGDW